jgi:hypothetical protein
MAEKLKKPVYCTCKNTKHELSPIVAILGRRKNKLPILAKLF